MLYRPALQRLLSDVKAGRVDTIVVYNVDRLTPSFINFTTLVETFDKVGTSFVSVTHSFSNRTGVGRAALVPAKRNLSQLAGDGEHEFALATTCSGTGGWAGRYDAGRGL